MVHDREDPVSKALDSQKAGYFGDASSRPPIHISARGAGYVSLQVSEHSVPQLYPESQAALDEVRAIYLVVPYDVCPVFYSTTAGTKLRSLVEFGHPQ